MADESTSAVPAAALRLRKHADYQRAYAAARKQHSRELSFFFARRDRMPARRLHPDEELSGLSGPRVGLTVPKVLGKAHDRNRIKRRMRAAVALHAGELVGLAVDVILHPRRSVLLLDWQELQREVQQAFRTVRKGFDLPLGTSSRAGHEGSRKTSKQKNSGRPKTPVKPLKPAS